MMQLKVNGAEQSFNGKPEMPLLWYLRDVLGLTASKFADNSWAALDS
jgi:isoquinoline 1-oxidoreductase subunit alpha